MNPQSQEDGVLPPGETDANVLYIAVGRAIHAWEGMEESLARIFAKMTGLPENPYALSDYGSENRRFVDRISAIKQAAHAYFIRNPDQALEGELDSILTAAIDLSIKRHRIAHGHISMWGHAKIPDTKGYFEVDMDIRFRWAAPFYSMTNLRTDPIGTNAASIDAVHDAFQNLNRRSAAFIGQMK